TKYYYRVGSEEKNTWSPWGYFSTDDKDNSFEFLHITDSQAKNAEQFDAYEDTLSKAFETAGVPDFIMATGDLVETGFVAPEWDLFFETTQDMMMKTTMAPASGNHEILPPPINYHFHIDTLSSAETSRIQYSYEYGNAVFAVLDTNVLSFSSQITWLENILSNSDKMFKIVAFHKSPFSSGNHAEQSDVMLIREHIVPVLSEYGVDLVLNGHDHIYCRTYPLIDKEIGSWDSRTETQLDGTTKITYNSPDGVIYSINRAIGSKFYNNSKDLNNHLIEVGDLEKPNKPVFSKVIIENNTLNYISYEHDRGNTDEVSIIDWFEIIK
ncbi:MAG: metallophosphoesterase, partial [Bacillota bacterium]